MAYVGNTPSRGQWRKLTDISGSFNGVTTTFTTSVPPGSSQYYVTAGTASQLIISLGGVIQEPDVDYTVSTNSITFTTAPAAGLSFFGVLCGDALNTGVPSDGSVTTSKLGSNLTVDLASGSAATPSLTFDANTGVYSPGEDQVAVSTGGTARLYIDSSGRVGIGTTGPSGILEASAGNTSTYAIIANSANSSGDQNFLQFRTGSTVLGDFNRPFGGNNIEFNAGFGAIAFGTGTAGTPSERARIDTSGRLLVGTSTASVDTLFQVTQPTDVDWCANLEHTTSSTTPLGLRIKYTASSPNNAGAVFLSAADSTATRAEIRSNGGLANYSANNVNLSDRNSKKDIALAGGTWDCLKEWEIVNFRYKDQPDDADLNMGVIAQQIAESCPEVITVFQEAKEATETEPAQEERIGVKEQQMMWMAIKALQEAQTRIETLEAEVAALKGA